MSQCGVAFILESLDDIEKGPGFPVEYAASKRRPQQAPTKVFIFLGVNAAEFFGGKLGG